MPNDVMSSALKGLLAGLAMGAVAVVAVWRMPRAPHPEVATPNQNATSELERVRAEAHELRAQNAEQAAELKQLRRNQPELLRLRGEVTRLREAAREATNPANSASPAAATFSQPPSGVASRPDPGLTRAPRFVVGAFRPADTWEDVGSSTPEEALESLHHAMQAKDRVRVAAAYLSPAELLATMPLPESGELTLPLPATDVTVSPTEVALAGTTILGREQLASGDVQLEIANHHVDGTVIQHTMVFRETADGWKLVPNLAELLQPPTP